MLPKAPVEGVPVLVKVPLPNPPLEKPLEDWEPCENMLEPNPGNLKMNECLIN